MTIQCGENMKIVEAFLREHESRFSTSTKRSYRLSLTQFFSFCQKDLVEIQPLDIRLWLASLKDLKPNTILAKLSGIRSFFHYCLEEGEVKKNPANSKSVLTPKKDDKLPYYLNKRQVALLQELTREHPRNRAIVEALFVTGVRISELLSIKVEDIKWDSRTIWVKGKGNKDRFVLFTPECAERMKTYLNNRKDESEFLFSNGRGGPLKPVTVRRKFNEYQEVLGFRVTPHTMRHTFAAHLAVKKMDQSYIQDLLGHVNLSSTQIYTRLMEDARKQEYDRYQI